MTTADANIERREETFRRWQPYGLLGIGTLLAAASARLLTPTAAGRTAVAVLVLAALVLQLWWGRAVRSRPGPGPASAAYYAVRWAIGSALTCLNPFLAFYAAAGCFDANELIPGRRLRWLGPFACSFPIATAQAGGLPFHNSMQWVAFGGLLVADNALFAIVGHLSEQSAQRSRARAATITELERANAALQQALEENASLHAQLLVQAREAGIADERGRLAAEIHDTLAQGLAGIITQLQAVANTPDPADARAHLARATDLARHSLGEARRSVHDLAPVGLTYDGLPQALRKTVDQWAERSGVRGEFTLTGTAQHLHGEVSSALLRITQEALANASKHALASRVGVTLSFMDDEVVLDVRDDGRGFDPLKPPVRTTTGGFGLEGMRARAARIAGSLTVESEPGGGTAVSARLPLARTAGTSAAVSGGEQRRAGRATGDDGLRA
ncbi:sensor histidine kinase [Streptomyces sp. MST-110588]|uniref:sensor histidine kinase n=1 Tax=Streptomyces sp. MST-110588 TaxID=2833628 RepID=UPI001F5C4849|nr:sensor histidine kinase [Streptomyces sp. MST-110588]UNO38871.1 sensor histidine kinase [Streptomyces sp. MST-110588]